MGKHRKLLSNKKSNKIRADSIKPSEMKSKLNRSNHTWFNWTESKYGLNQLTQMWSY